MPTTRVAFVAVLISLGWAAVVVLPGWNFIPVVLFGFAPFVLHPTRLRQSMTLFSRQSAAALTLLIVLIITGFVLNNAFGSEVIKTTIRSTWFAVGAWAISMLSLLVVTRKKPHGG